LSRTPGTQPDTARVAQEHLVALAGPDARLRDDQREAIASLVDRKQRVLVVQRTGWGKSAVYFIATRLLRDRGSGPTLIVSPLLALMRDQLVAARRMGLSAETLNSTNVEEWAEIEQRVRSGGVDLLLVSPERLNHPRFRQEILDRLVARIGLLVIDEAHCISEWGHDFRPDFRRLRDVLDRLSTARDEAVPVVACTATATDRVVLDVADQLASLPDGSKVEVSVLRGSLARDTLRLQVVRLPTHEERLAWLATFLAGERASGRAGIVYTLTIAEAERTTDLLRVLGHDVAAYTSKLDAEPRARLEDDLRSNRLAAVVATTALSMGYDKPDLGFVVHLGAPSSPVAYYQAVGRAGRGGHQASVVCLPTGLDERLWHHFDVAGLPTAADVESIVSVLEPRDTTSLPSLETRVNLRRTRLELLLKVLDVEGIVERVDGGYRVTGRPYVHDQARYDRLLHGRRAEHAVMRDYLDPAGARCRMLSLTAALDDTTGGACGRCDRCLPPAAAPPLDPVLVDRAREHLRGQDVVLPPRRRWPTGLNQLDHPRRGNIPRDHQATEGRVLADGDGSGWSEVVGPLLEASRDGEPIEGDRFETVIGGLVRLLARWDWATRPEAIVTVPSRTHAALLRETADRLGRLGGLPVHHDLLVRAAETPRQATMDNSAHQAGNALSAYRLAGPVPAGAVLLLDATVGSGWTLTVCAMRLAEGGSGPVLPLVLASTR
jgi:ATP-dependent DNA helicase RecQ